MNNYIDLLRNIVKNFKYSNEFDDIIKRILNLIFNNYYVNREKYIYNIDNLYKKYDVIKYDFIKKKYRISKKEDLIFRFNRYNKKYYINKLLKNNEIKNLNTNKRICYFPPCLNNIIGTNNYCYLHNKDSV